MSTELQTKGHGRIRVSESLWAEIGKPETPEAWHKAILLPDTVEVERVERKDYETTQDSLFEVYVTSESIPPCETQIEISPIHRRHEDGTVTFERLLMQTWDGERWQKVGEQP